MPPQGIYYLELAVSQAILDHLNTLPLGARRFALERAINRALDAEGWPQGDRGTIAIPASYWYVTVWKRDTYQLRGHVGPIVDEGAAKRAARSWSTAGFIAEPGRFPKGPCLTNPLNP